MICFISGLPKAAATNRILRPRDNPSLSWLITARGPSRPGCAGTTREAIDSSLRALASRALALPGVVVLVIFLRLPISVGLPPRRGRVPGVTKDQDAFGRKVPRRDHCHVHAS